MSCCMCHYRNEFIDICIFFSAYMCLLHCNILLVVVCPLCSYLVGALFTNKCMSCLQMNKKGQSRSTNRKCKRDDPKTWNTCVKGKLYNTSPKVLYNVYTKHHPQRETNIFYQNIHIHLMISIEISSLLYRLLHIKGKMLII